MDRPPNRIPWMMDLTPIHWGLAVTLWKHPRKRFCQIQFQTQDPDNPKRIRKFEDWADPILPPMNTPAQALKGLYACTADAEYRIRLAEHLRIMGLASNTPDTFPDSK